MSGVVLILALAMVAGAAGGGAMAVLLVLQFRSALDKVMSDATRDRQRLLARHTMRQTG